MFSKVRFNANLFVKLCERCVNYVRSNFRRRIVLDFISFCGDFISCSVKTKMLLLAISNGGPRIEVDINVHVAT